MTLPLHPGSTGRLLDREARTPSGRSNDGPVRNAAITVEDETFGAICRVAVTAPAISAAEESWPGGPPKA